MWSNKKIYIYILIFSIFTLSVVGVLADNEFEIQDLGGSLYRGAHTSVYYYQDVGAGYSQYGADQVTGWVYNTETSQYEETYVVCIQPSVRGMADDFANWDLYSSSSKNASDRLRKIMFYGHASASNVNKKATWYPDDYVDVAMIYAESGLEAYLITHVAASKVYGSSDWNETPGGVSTIYSSFVTKVNNFINDVDNRPDPPSNYYAKIYSRASYQDYLVETGGPLKGKLKIIKQSSI